MIVAPRVGAWIETLVALAKDKEVVSHPVWVRGLKPFKLLIINDINQVAPRVGAWIETHKRFGYNEPIELSHPVWVRGLKHSSRAIF